MINIATLSDFVWIPYDCFSRKQAEQINTTLVTIIKNRDYSAPSGVTAYKEPTVIENFRICKDSELFGAPIAYGMWYCQQNDIEIVEKNVCPHASYAQKPNPYHPKAPRGQAHVFNESVECLKRDGFLLLQVATGGGKTATACNAIHALQCTALVVVPKKELAKQWRLEAKKHLGLTDEEIGTVEENVIDYKGKKITICVIHNLSQKQFDPDFYESFGMIVYDEAHNLGAQTFSGSLKGFKAKYRLGLSATPKRKDSAERVFTQWLGQPLVIDTVEAIPCDVYTLPIDNKGKLRGRNLAGLISCMATLPSRNRMLAQVIANFYDEPSGRHIIAMSDRTEQLEEIARILKREHCVADSDITIFARTKVNKHSDTKELLARRIILATYGMGKEGLDIPILSMGIDLTPRSDGNQQVGRIRRRFDKPQAIWITPFDKDNAQITGIHRKRLSDYEKAGCRIVGNYVENFQKIHLQNS